MPPAAETSLSFRPSDDTSFKSAVPQILIPHDQLQRRIQELGNQLSEDYRGRCPYLVVILNGAFMFVADLVRAMSVYTEVGFMAVSSYGDSTRSSGTVRITKDLQRDIFERDVIIIEDIVDTGLTVHHLLDLFGTRHPKSLRICSLLSKSECRKVEVPVDYVGFEIPNHFVVGYGLDYRQHYRHLPYIGVLDVDVANAEIDAHSGPAS